MPAPATQAVLLISGLLPVLVMWDRRQHAAALLSATAVTVCCWRISPGWAGEAMLGVTAIAVILCARSFAGHGRGAGRRAVRARQIELLAERAQREQWTTIAVLPARLRAYSALTELLAAEREGSPPPPPAEPRPGPIALWEQLDNAHRVAAAVAVAGTAGLAKRGARRYACQRLAAAASELAQRIERDCEEERVIAREDSEAMSAGPGGSAR